MKTQKLCYYAVLQHYPVMAIEVCHVLVRLVMARGQIYTAEKRLRRKERLLCRKKFGCLVV